MSLAVIADEAAEYMASPVSTEAEEFAERGYLHLRGFFDSHDLEQAESAILQLHEMQAKKIAGYREQLGDVIGDAYEDGNGAEDALAGIQELLEPNDKEALYQVQKMLPGSQTIRSVFSPPLMRRAGYLLDDPNDDLLLEGPGLFINRPNTQRLLYKWHQEGSCCYPQRRRFVNAWLPLFGDKTAENGAMSVLVGSHKAGPFPFSKYQGYDKDTEGKANHFVQYEIPENFLTGYREHRCVAKRGDLILFDRMTVHRSNPNTTDKYSFALVARIWTPADDLTLSGEMTAQDGGRPGLVVNP